MPFAITLVNEVGDEVIDNASESYRITIQGVVATAFHQSDGAQVFAMASVYCEKPIYDANLPVPLALTIIAYWRPERAIRQEAIRAHIEREIRSFHADLATTEVHLNLVGAPRLVSPPGRPAWLPGDELPQHEGIPVFDSRDLGDR